MSQEQPKPNMKLYLSLGVMCVGIGLFLFAYNGMTVDVSVVPAPCELIKNPNYAIPENVITKGYDIVRDENGTVVKNICYYLKEAGLIERVFYSWKVYE